jgi:hypothetical protein
MMKDPQDLAERQLESSQAIQRRLDETAEMQRGQLFQILNELKGINRMANWCGMAALIFVVSEVIRWFR